MLGLLRSRKRPMSHRVRRALLIAVVAAVVIAALEDDSDDGAMEAVAPFDDDTWLFPPIKNSADRLNLASYRRSCLVRRGGDRLAVEKESATFEGSTHHRSGTAFMASDLCALGHTTKDAALLLSWFLDHHALRPKGGDYENAANGKVNHWDLSSVVYGNLCMERRAQHSNKKSAIFHNVLLAWFRASLDEIRSVMHDSGKHSAVGGKESDGTSSRLKALAAESGVNEIFSSDFNRGRERVCFDRVVKREAEQWRWFRSAAHADRFRLRLWKRFNVTQRKQKRCSAPTTVTVLVRGEDRHFREVHVARAVAVALTDTHNVHVRAATFDRAVGRAGKQASSDRAAVRHVGRHAEQLQLFRDTDVLIGAHGAGLASVAAMRKGTTMIELFPHNFQYAMYGELSQLMGVDYVGFESPVVHPSGCCRARGKDNTMAVLSVPSDGNGVGARACKKCDIAVTDDEMVTMVRRAVASTLLQRGCGTMLMGLEDDDN
jgi:hypothetical protein